MSGIRIPVPNEAEPVGGALERFGNAVIDEGGTKWKIPTGDAFGGNHYVGLYAMAAAAGLIAGTSESGDHLISYQQDSVLVADFAYERPEIGRWHDKASRARH